MPRPADLLKFGERWRPYRSVATWYMWRAFERAGYAATNKIRPHKLKRKAQAQKTKSGKTRPAKSQPRKTRRS
jgi:DNA-3-methyladenine glycosylase II